MYGYEKVETTNAAISHTSISHPAPTPTRASVYFSTTAIAESAGFEPTEQLSPLASLAMRCFRPLSQLSNSTLSHDRVEQCLTKNFFTTICRCIIVGIEGFEPPLSEPKADVLTVTLYSNTTLSMTKIRIIFQNTKFYSHQFSSPPSAKSINPINRPKPRIIYQIILKYRFLYIENFTLVASRLKLCNQFPCVELR